jgi:cell division protein FtsX
VHDLDTRLERLAAEATRHAVPPEPETITRRGRRRRRAQLAGTALLAAVVAVAGLILPARLAGRSGSPAGQLPAGAGTTAGRIDATVLLDRGITPEQRAAALRRIQALDVVDAVYYEPSRDAYVRFRARHRNDPDKVRNADPADFAASFQVRLDAPASFKQLLLALCRPGKDAEGRQRCIEGVEAVRQSREKRPERLLSSRWWPAGSDVTLTLARGATDAQRNALRIRLEAIDGVVKVTYWSPEEAYRRLPEKARRGPDPIRPERMLGSFHVTLTDPARRAGFQEAFCGRRLSKADRDCSSGIVVEVTEHPRR